MPFQALATFSLGTSRTGLTDLRAQPRKADGTATGAAITTGFSEGARGMYRFSGSVPDDTAFIDCTSAGVAAVFDSVPAYRFDNLDAAVSSRGTSTLTASDLTVPFVSQGFTTGRAAKLDNLDAAVTSRSTLAVIDVATALAAYGTAKASDVSVTVDGGFGAGDAAKLDGLASRATEARLAKLDVSGTLANTANADTFKADLSDLLTLTETDPADDDKLRFTADALANAPAPSPGAGDGEVAIDHNFGGADALRAVHNGVGVGGVNVRAFVRSEYESGAAVAPVRSRIVTKDDGRFAVPLMLDRGVEYALVFDKPGDYRTTVRFVTVPSV